MLVEGNGIVELVDAKTVLGKAGNIRTKQSAAGGHDQPIVGEALLRTLGSDDLHHARLGVDRLGAALHIDNIDRPKDVLQRCRYGLGLCFVEPRADYQRWLRCDQRYIEFFGRNTLDVAQAGSRKYSVHADEVDAYLPIRATSRGYFRPWSASARACGAAKRTAPRSARQHRGATPP